MTDWTLAQQLAQFVTAADWTTLPEPVKAKAPGRVVDIVGLCLAASRLDTSVAVGQFVASEGGAAQATAIGLRQQLPATAAAFVNGVLAHSLDYDDTHLPSILHPSASIVPAALATSELTGCDGPRMLTAVAVGIEVCVRLGMAGYDPTVRQSLFFDRGQHATSICGTLGAAAAAGYILGLSADQVAHAIGIAASMGSGVIEANRTGGTVKRIHCGWAAKAGLTAAQLARGGITGPPTVLEGRFGFYSAWLDGQFDPNAISTGLGVVWALPALHDKPYPANHFTHAVADAAIALRDNGISPTQIDTVRIAVAAPTVRTIGEPIAAKRRPESGYHAKFSAPYVFAAALFGGGGLGLSHADFDDAMVADPQRRALMDRVTVEASAECDAIYPNELPAIVTVTTHDGREHVQRVLSNRGGPSYPLSAAELTTKFTDNARGVLGDGKSADLLAGLHSLPTATRVADSFNPRTLTPEVAQ